MAYQVCNLCGAPVRMCGGALCGRCRRDARQQQSETAAGRAEILLHLLAQARMRDLAEERAEEQKEFDEQLLASAAAHQLAMAWGVRIGRA